MILWESRSKWLVKHTEEEVAKISPKYHTETTIVLREKSKTYNTIVFIYNTH